MVNVSKYQYKESAYNIGVSTYYWVFAGVCVCVCFCVYVSVYVCKTFQSLSVYYVDVLCMFIIVNKHIMLR